MHSQALAGAFYAGPFVDAFGAGGEGYLRLCYAQSNDRLSLAMDRFEEFLRKS